MTTLARGGHSRLPTQIRAAEVSTVSRTRGHGSREPLREGRRMLVSGGSCGSRCNDSAHFRFAGDSVFSSRDSGPRSEKPTMPSEVLSCLVGAVSLFFRNVLRPLGSVEIVPSQHPHLKESWSYHTSCALASSERRLARAAMDSVAWKR